MKDIYVVGTKWPEMIVKLPNAKIVTFESEQTIEYKFEKKNSNMPWPDQTF